MNTPTHKSLFSLPKYRVKKGQNAVVTSNGALRYVARFKHLYESMLQMKIGVQCEKIAS